MDDEKKAWAEDIISLYQEQLGFVGEIVDLTELFFKTSIEYDAAAQKVLEEDHVIDVLQVFTNYLIELDEFTADNIQAQMKATQKETKQRGRKLFMPLRVATTGQTHGPELPKAIELLGKDVVITRLNELLD